MVYVYMSLPGVQLCFIVFIAFSCYCCCCCCKSCRTCWFKVWDRWTRKLVGRKLVNACVYNITNVQGKQPTIRYDRIPRTSPPPSPSHSVHEPKILTPMIENGNKETQSQPPTMSLRRSLSPNDKNFR
jgi:hypothetical protein